MCNDVIPFYGETLMSLIVKKTETKSRTFSVRIPAQLVEDLDSLRADAERSGYSVDVAAVVIAALTKAVKEARSELAKEAASAASSHDGSHHQ